MTFLAKWLAFLFGMALSSAVFAQSTFVSMVPVRLMDTRSGGATVDGQFSGGGPTSSTTLTVLGRAGIPTSGVSAVALNVTAMGSANLGYLVVWPTGTTQPLASNLNYVPGQSISNQIIAKIGSGGQVSIVSSGGSNIVVDVAGYFPTNSDLTPLTPARLLDTRPGMTTVDGQYAGGGAIAPGATFDLPVVGRGGVPGSSVSAVVVNITATQTTGPTYITVWPSGAPQPNASNLNATSAGQTIANLVMVAPGSNGKISIYNNYGNTHLIVDVVGLFSSTSTLVPLVPARLLDTRPGMSTIDGQFLGQGPVGPGGKLDLTVVNRGGVPGLGIVGAIALNVTVVSPTTPGYIVAWGAGTTSGTPQAMDINFNTGDVIPSLVIAQVGANGKVSLYNSSGSTSLVADVVGWFPSAPPISSNVSSYRYDSNGRLVAVSSLTDARQYNYDIAGNLYSIATTAVFTSSAIPPIETLRSASERLLASDASRKSSGDKAIARPKATFGKALVNAESYGAPHLPQRSLTRLVAGHVEPIAFSLPPSAQIQHALLTDGRTLEIHGAQGVAYLIDGVKRQSLALPEIRRYGSATAMPGGQILLWGGVDSRGKIIPTGEWFDAASGVFTPTGDLGLPARAGHTLTVLTDGRLLLSGGWGTDGLPANTSVLWQPASHRAIAVKGAPDVRLAATATLQADGTVRIGDGVNALGKSLSSVMYFDPNVSKMASESKPIIMEMTQDVTTFPKAGSLAASLHGPLVLRFARPVNVRELKADTITLIGPTGPVSTQVVATNEGRLAFVQVPDDLYPGSRYTLFVKGLHAADGVALSDATAGFATETSPAKSVMLAGDGNRRTAPDQEVISGQSPLVVMTGDGKTCSDTTNHLCREQSFLRDGAWYPGKDNTPDETGGHWRLYQSRSTLPDTSALERTLPANSTALIGQVRQIDEKPVANVEVSIGAHKVRTDASGVFVLKDVPAGRQEVFVDGRSASQALKQYGRFLVGADIEEKTINHMPFVMYVPRVLPRDEVTLPAPTTQEVVVTHPDMPGLEIHIPPGTVLRDREGKVLTKIAIVPTPVDRAPFPLPDNFPMYFTVQPSDAVIQGLTAQAGQGIRVVYPNYGKAAPHTVGNFWVYDVQAGWKMYGGGHVTDDAKHLAPDPGVSLVWAVGAGASLGNSEPPAANRPNGACAANPIDLQTGIFYHEWDDMQISDVVPLVLHRTYNSADSASHAFGQGGSANFGMHLYSSDGSFTQPQLVLECGQSITFSLASGTATFPFTGTVWKHQASNSGYYGATLQFLYNTSAGSYWLIVLRNGTQYAFDAHAPNHLQWMKDRFGNLTQYHYNGGLIDQIISPNNRTLSFNYDSANHIIKATDNSQRSVSYTYSTGSPYFLTKVTYPDTTTEIYTYQLYSSNPSRWGLSTMKNRAGTVWVTNQYDTNGRVFKQTLADQSTYQFNYTVGANNTVTETLVTNPNNNQDRYVFDAVSQYPASITRAYGTSLAQTTTYVRAASGLISSQTDALSRKTDYLYDTAGNLKSITQLSGTASAAVTTLTYTPDYNQIASITDPLFHTTQFGYNSQGCLTSITDANNNTTNIVCNADGQPSSVTDALGHAITMGYLGADLHTVKDALSRSTTLTTDPVGRVTKILDPFQQPTTLGYDSLDSITSLTPPQGFAATYQYSSLSNTYTTFAGGGLQSSQIFTSNTSNFSAMRTDSLNQSESATYNGVGNLKTYTDRKGQQTTYTYDALDRLSQIAYSDGNTAVLHYDAGNRLTQVVDSVSGTITRNYDLFDNLKQEQTPQGTVNYTYDAAGRRATMTAASQAQVIYTFDPANRLTQIKQGSEIVSIGYDAANRRRSITLPNGIVTTYNYDDANQLTNIVYRTSSYAVLSSIAYTYDLAGRRIKKIGGFATDPLASVTPSDNQFDSNERLTQYYGYSFTYDSNGDLSGNSVPQVYYFDARHRLVQFDQGGVTGPTFSYDFFGRRTSKTIGGVTTTFLYDGINPVQETQGGTISAVLNGLGIDERYARSEPAGRRYFLTDALGSTVALTDINANVQQTYAYEPYGQMTSSGSSTNSYQYTGRENDGNGYYYYRARYYHPGIKRFISEDPIGLAGGFNGYAYADGDPVDINDPYGLFSAADLPTAPQGLVDGVTGFGDGINLFGFSPSRAIRNGWGIDGGVNKCSPEYLSSRDAGKWYSVMVPVAGRLGYISRVAAIPGSATSVAGAYAARAAIKGEYRSILRPIIDALDRDPTLADILAKAAAKGDAYAIARAGITNGKWSAAIFGASALAAIQQLQGDDCTCEK